MDTILTYGGKPVTEMSREELIDALTEVAGMIDLEREAHRLDLEAWQRIAASRKRPLDPSRASDLIYHDDAPPLPSAFKGLSER